MYSDLTRFPDSSDIKCHRCGKLSITNDFSSGEIFCKNCGMIIEQKTTNASQDLRVFDFENDLRHTGSPRSVAIHDFGLSTVIGKTNVDASGKAIPIEASNTIKRIRIQDKRSQAHKNTDANFKVAFGTLQRIQDKIGVSDNIREVAAHIYRKAVERKIIQGRSIDALAAASMYAACRNTETLRTLRDISDATDIKRKTISQSYRAIVKQLDIQIPVVDQTKCILKISNNLKLSSKTKHLALKIMQKAESAGIVAGRDPTGISAAAIYFACVIKQEPFTQAQISHASGITAVTIRNRFYEIQKKISSQNL